MKHKKISKNPNLIFFIVLLMIAIRPIVDLQGRYEEGALNLGGVFGAMVTMIIIVIFLFYKKKKNNFLIILLLIFFGIISFWLIHLIVNFKTPILAELSRIIIGFSPFLLYFVINKINPELFYRFYRIFMFFLIIPIGISVLQYVHLIPFSYYDVIDGIRVGRPSGGYFQPSSLSRLLIFSIIFAYIFYYSGKISSFQKNFTVIIMSLSTILTSHRTSVVIILLLILILEIYLIQRQRKVTNKKVINFLKLTFGISFILIAIPKLREFIIENFIKLSSTIGSLDFNSRDFLRGRGWRWDRTVSYMEDSDLANVLIGHGYQVYESHNDVLNIYMLLGVIGVFLFLAFYLVLYLYIYLQVNGKGRMLLTSVYIYIIFFGITLQPTGYPNFMWLFMISTLMISIIFNKSTEKGIEL